MPDNFTNEELLIIDVALTEFIWSLEEELTLLEKDVNTGADYEIDQLLDMLETAEELHNELADILGGVNEYV